MGIFIFLGIVFLVAFTIQRKFALNTVKLVSKVLPILFLLCLLLSGYIAYVFKIHEIKSREIYTSMATAETDIIFTLFALSILTAIVGSIFGLVSQRFIKTRKR